MKFINSKAKLFGALLGSLLLMSVPLTATLPLLAVDETKAPDSDEQVYRAFLPIAVQADTLAATETEDAAALDAPLVEADDNDNFADEVFTAAGQSDEVQAAERKVIRYDDLPDVADFVFSGRKWTKIKLTYYFQNGTNDIAGTGEKTAIKQAFALWATVTLSGGKHLSFSEVTSASKADIVILFGVGAHGDGFPFDGLNGVLAHAFYPPPNGGAIAGDAHFDDAERWTAGTRMNGAQPIDLVTVAAHEIGHSLGLGHSSISTALMAPFYTGSHRFLSADDLNGIRFIYP